MFPIRDHNPSGQTPYVTFTLIAINVLVFLWYFTSLTEWDTQRLFMTWGLVPARVLSGEGLETVVTSMFLHAGWMHLGGNMLFLWIFGDNLEEEMGHLGFLIFYLACGAAAGLAQALPDPGTLTPMVGASGAIAGVMAQPFTGEMYFADGKSSRYRGPDGDKLLKTSSVKTLGDAILFTTTPALFKDDKRVAYDRLEQAVKLARYGTDCYASALIAAGQIDLVIEAGLQAYDVLAPISVIEASGGIVTDWKGRPAHDGGQILAAASREIHAEALALLHG